MKIELNENKILFNNGKSVQEIHPFWLRERVDGDKFLDKGTELWKDYDFGAVIGFKLQENLGFYVEGKYLDYWERPAYDIKVGLNYQFVGFGL